MFRKLNFLYLQLLNSFGSSSRFQVGLQFDVPCFKIPYIVSVWSSSINDCHFYAVSVILSGVCGVEGSSRRNILIIALWLDASTTLSRDSMNRKSKSVLSTIFLFPCQEIEKPHLRSSLLFEIKRPWLKDDVFLFCVDFQQFIRLLKFSPISARKESRAHIRDSRAVSFAYLCSRIV